MVLVFIVLNSKTLLRFSTLLYEIRETGFLWATTVWFSVWTKPENRLAAAAAAAKSLQSCLTLCNPIDSSPPGSPIPGILQATVLEWVTISFSRGSSQPRDRIHVSHIAGEFFTSWAIRESSSGQPFLGSRSIWKLLSQIDIISKRKTECQTYLMIVYHNV